MIRRLLLAIVLGSLSLPCQAEPIDFAQQVYPILRQHCFKCHGEDKQAGELDLHLPSEIEMFGVVVAGEPDESSLYERITLAADDELRMPKESAPLTAEQIATIRQWIEEGATMPADEVVAPSLVQQFDLPEVPPATEAAIARVRQTGANVTPLYVGSPLLQVSFAQTPTAVGDEDLRPLSELAPQVVSLNLARCAVTDEGLSALRPLKNLMRLHLEQTGVTDEGLTHLSELGRLEYLNLYGTSVSDAGLAHLAGLSRLRQLYLWQSQVSAAAAMDLQQRIEGLQVNLGADPPNP